MDLIMGKVRGGAGNKGPCPHRSLGQRGGGGSGREVVAVVAERGWR